jgi:hypothetical protein
MVIATVRRPAPSSLPPEDGKGACAFDDACRAQADLQGLFGGELIRPETRLSRLHDPHAGFGLAFRTVAHRQPSSSRLSFDTASSGDDVVAFGPA